MQPAMSVAARGGAAASHLRLVHLMPDAPDAPGTPGALVAVV